MKRLACFFADEETFFWPKRVGSRMRYYAEFWEASIVREAFVSLRSERRILIRPPPSVRRERLVYPDIVKRQGRTTLWAFNGDWKKSRTLLVCADSLPSCLFRAPGEGWQIVQKKFRLPPGQAPDIVAYPLHPAPIPRSPSLAGGASGEVAPPVQAPAMVAPPVCHAPSPGWLLAAGGASGEEVAPRSQGTCYCCTLASSRSKSSLALPLPRRRAQ